MYDVSFSLLQGKYFSTHISFSSYGIVDKPISCFELISTVRSGAAITFTKIKQMPREHDPEAGDKYWQTPMMYSNKTLDVVDSGWRNGSGSPWDLYSGSVHHYDRPIDIFGSCFQEKGSHFASNNVVEAKSRLPQNNYHRLSPINLLSHNQNLL